jgi:hypothetical protein
LETPANYYSATARAGARLPGQLLARPLGLAITARAAACRNFTAWGRSANGVPLVRPNPHVKKSGLAGDLPLNYICIHNGLVRLTSSHRSGHGGQADPDVPTVLMLDPWVVKPTDLEE